MLALLILLTRSHDTLAITVNVYVHPNGTLKRFKEIKQPIINLASGSLVGIQYN